MQTNLKAVTAAGIQRCREDGSQCDAVEVAYLACLLEEQRAWPSLEPRSSSPNTRRSSTAGTPVPQEAAAETTAAAEPSQQQQQQPQHAQLQQKQQLTLCSASKLPEAALAAMAERLRRELLQPADPAAAATARLQVLLERSFKEQQDKVEAEQAQHTGTTSRLASAVAYKKVNMQAAGLPLYQSVFDQVVEYVCAAAGLEAKAASDPDARAQVSAAVESVLPLSSLAYFLTLPAQERMQQLESLAAISCGICLFNSHTGNAPSPLTLSADTQLLQARRLLSEIQAAAAHAEAAFEHYTRQSTQQQQQALAAEVPPVLAAAAAAYLGSSNGAATAGNPSSSGAVQLGAALFCCQAAVALRALAVDLDAGLKCCRQLHIELLSVLTQAAQAAFEVSGAVPKEQVFPLFESAGHMFHALKGELRLLLVRGRLWEAASAALAAAAQQPGVPGVLGFSARRRPGSASVSSTRSSSVVAAHTANASTPAAVFDSSALPADMEYVAAARAAAAAEALEGDEAGAGIDIFGCCDSTAAAAAEQHVLTLSGMCPVSLASSVAAGAAAVSAVDGSDAAEERLLVGSFARPEHGMIRYGGKLYGFSSPAALAAFVSGPEAILDAVRQAAHNAPLLLHLLGLSATAGAPQPPSGSLSPPASGAGTASATGLSTQGPSSSSSSPVNGYSASGPGGGSSTGGYMFRGSSAGTRRSSGGGGGVVRWRMPPLRGLLQLFEAPLKVEAATQTVTHVVERLIDVNYEWNEWALRRRIIALANLRHKATHSAQTLMSQFRREGTSQTWLPKEAAVQTRVNRGSSVPKKLRYVTGLRGAPDTKMAVVSLELDVHGKGARAKPGRL